MWSTNKSQDWMQQLSQTSGAEMLVVIPRLQDYDSGYSLFKHLKAISYHS